MNYYYRGSCTWTTKLILHKRFCSYVTNIFDIIIAGISVGNCLSSMLKREIVECNDLSQWERLNVIGIVID